MIENRSDIGESETSLLSRGAIGSLRAGFVFGKYKYNSLSFGDVPWRSLQAK
jgi:hypothetical protein